MGVTGLLLVGPFYYTYVALYWGVQIYEYHCIKERFKSINCWGYSDRKFGLNALAQRFENNDIATSNSNPYFYLQLPYIQDSIAVHTTSV